MDGVPADTKKKVRVVVADDHPLYRDGVVRALTASGRVDVVAQSEGGRDALEQIREHSPDVALIDYKLPDLDGVSVVHAVTRDGRDLMLNSWVFDFDTKRVSTRTHVLAGLMFALYPLWWWLGWDHGRRVRPR